MNVMCTVTFRLFVGDEVVLATLATLLFLLQLYIWHYLAKLVFERSLFNRPKPAAAQGVHLPAGIILEILPMYQTLDRSSSCQKTATHCPFDNVV